jgi:1,4-dihydroxy-2-naphthoate octaprenyltransferase
MYGENRASKAGFQYCSQVGSVPVHWMRVGEHCGGFFHHDYGVVQEHLSHRAGGLRYHRFICAGKMLEMQIVAGCWYPSLMTARQFLAVVEIRTKIISVSTYLIGTLYVVWSGTAVRPVVAVLLAVSVLCVDMGTTALNSFFDYVRGVDTGGRIREKNKVLVHEGVAPGHALIAGIALFAIATGTGIAVAWLTTWWLVVAGVIGMTIGFLYTGGPLPISRTPVGEIFAGGALGSLLFLVVVTAHAGLPGWTEVIASLPSTLMIASVLTVNNTCDVEGDREAGRRTLSLLVGSRWGEALVYLQGAGTFGLLVLMAGSCSGTVLPDLPAVGVWISLAGFLLAVVLYIRMHRRGYAHGTKGPQMVDISRIVIVFTLAYAGTLVAGMGI